MKNKNLFKTVCSVLLVALVISATIFASKESKGIELNVTSGKGRLVYIVDNINLNGQATATASGAEGFYYGTVTGSNRVTFPEMPAGSYKIIICKNVTIGNLATGYSHTNKSLQYNGGAQTEYVSLIQTGPCTGE